MQEEEFPLDRIPFSFFPFFHCCWLFYPMLAHWNADDLSHVHSVTQLSKNLWFCLDFFLVRMLHVHTRTLAQDDDSHRRTINNNHKKEERRDFCI